MKTSEGASFEEVARQALRATEEIFREKNPLSMPNLLSALAEDSLLNIEDFLVERNLFWNL